MILATIPTMVDLASISKLELIQRKSFETTLRGNGFSEQSSPGERTSYASFTPRVTPFALREPFSQMEP